MLLYFSFHFISFSFPAPQKNRKSADKLSDGRNVVSGLLEVFSAMFQGYCPQCFFGSFPESRIQNRKTNALAVTDVIVADGDLLFG